MKNIIERILEERKRNIQKGLHKDANLGRLVLRLSNTMYGITGIHAITEEQFDKMVERLNDTNTDKGGEITWDSYIV